MSTGKNIFVKVIKQSIVQTQTQQVPFSFSFFFSVLDEKRKKKAFPPPMTLNCVNKYTLYNITTYNEILNIFENGIHN